MTKNDYIHLLNTIGLSLDDDDNLVSDSGKTYHPDTKFLLLYAVPFIGVKFDGNNDVFISTSMLKYGSLHEEYELRGIAHGKVTQVMAHELTNIIHYESIKSYLKIVEKIKSDRNTALLNSKHENDILRKLSKWALENIHV